MNKIFKNSIANILQAIIVTPIFFLLVPYIIAKIGVVGYGLFALTGVIASYQVFVEMGLTTTLIRFVAQAKVSEQYSAISEYIGTALIAFILISIVAVLVIYFSSSFIATKILGLKEDIPLVVFLIRIASITAVVNLLSGVFKSAIDGVQRMDISNSILTVQVILTAIGTVIALEKGFGVKGLLINGLIVSHLSLFANFYFSKKTIPYRFILKFSRTRFKEMFSYSVNLQLSSLLFFWIEPLNKIIISNYFSVAYVGYYDIALKFNSRITSLVRSGLSSMFPAAAEKFEKTGGDGIESLRRTSLKYMFPLLTAIYIIGIFITPPFIELWLGSQYHVVTIAICIFLLGSFFSILSTPSYILLLGSGFSGDTLRIQWQSMLVNVVVIVVFTLIFGFYGFCAGYSVAMLYGFYVTHVIYQKRFAVSPNAFRVFLNLRVLISGLVIMATGIAFLTIVQVVSWILLIGMIALMVIIAFLSIWKLQIITGKDIGNLFGVVDLKSILPHYRKNL